MLYNPKKKTINSWFGDTQRIIRQILKPDRLFFDLRSSAIPVTTVNI